MAEELSTYDVKILEQLQRNAEQSTADLADKVGLSQSPCWRRLQRLKEEGYIRSQVALLDRRKLGHELVIFSTFKMQTLSDEKRAEFLRKIESIPEITECHTIFGEMDVLVKVIAPSMTLVPDVHLQHADEVAGSHGHSLDGDAGRGQVHDADPGARPPRDLNRRAHAGAPRGRVSEPGDDRCGESLFRAAALAPRVRHVFARPSR